MWNLQIKATVLSYVSAVIPFIPGPLHGVCPVESPYGASESQNQDPMGEEDGIHAARLYPVWRTIYSTSFLTVTAAVSNNRVLYIT